MWAKCPNELKPIYFQAAKECKIKRLNQIFRNLTLIFHLEFNLLQCLIPICLKHWIGLARLSTGSRFFSFQLTEKNTPFSIFKQTETAFIKSMRKTQKRKKNTEWETKRCEFWICFAYNLFEHELHSFSYVALTLIYIFTYLHIYNDNDNYFKYTLTYNEGIRAIALRMPVLWGLPSEWASECVCECVMICLILLVICMQNGNHFQYSWHR